MKKLMPVIKWPGSKRSIATQLHALWPLPRTPGSTYFEPFIGSGAMLPGRPCGDAVAGDVIGPLIELWNAIVDRPDDVADHYASVWDKRQATGHTVYYDVRARFNEHYDPLDFMVLSRMCVNGLIRFNKRGEFNNSLHHTRPGIKPETLRSLLHAWAGALRNVHFLESDFEDTLAPAKDGDFVFLDPPYLGTRGRYKPVAFDFDRLWGVIEELNDKGVFWIMTLDGKAGSREYNSSAVPDSLYVHKFLINTGNSPFTRLMNTSVDSVLEAVYLNFDPPGTELLRRVTQAE